LEYLAQELRDVKKLQDFSKVRKLHSEYTSICIQTRKKMECGEEIEAAIAENLEWLVEKCLEERQWQVGIELCDEGLKYCDTIDKETVFQREQLGITREDFEVELSVESLNAAESAMDLIGCLESFERLERLRSNQRQNKVPARWSYIMLSDKQMEFLRGVMKMDVYPA
jgi:hypothetical protein